MVRGRSHDDPSTPFMTFAVGALAILALQWLVPTPHAPAMAARPEAAVAPIASPSSHQNPQAPALAPQIAVAASAATALNDAAGAAPRAAGVEAAAPAGEEDSTEMPLRVFFRTRARLSKIVGTVRNLGTSPKAVLIRVLDPTTSAVTEVSATVTVDGETIFGLSDGIELHAGDQVALHCEPYPDLTIEVPG